MSRVARRRITAGESAFTHVVSHAGAGRRFDAETRARFKAALDRQLEFTGLECVTYAFLTDRFHLLLHLPDPSSFIAGVDDGTVLGRLALVYDDRRLDIFRDELEALRKAGRDREADAMVKVVTDRMFLLSPFMKEFKGTISRGVNRRSRTRGGVWEERFRSMHVEPGDALRTVAAYTDLAAVRDGEVSDPAMFEFSGFGAASAGDAAARQNLQRFLGGKGVSWDGFLESFRPLLYGQTGELLEPEVIAARLRGKEELSRAQLLRCHCRYLTDGVAVGSEGFVEEFFKEHRSSFGTNRKSGARKMRFGDWGGLCTLRDMQVNVIRVGSFGDPVEIEGGDG